MIERTPHSQHHKWGEPNRLIRKTERVCARCGMVKATRHEEYVWIEFWMGLDRVPQFGERTPICTAILETTNPSGGRPDSHGDVTHEHAS